MHMADALEATLPSDFGTRPVIERAWHRRVTTGGAAHRDAGLAGWVVWPVGEFIARRGMAHRSARCELLHALTQRFTAEWAIRPFIVAHPALAFATLQRWTQDPERARAPPGQRRQPPAPAVGAAAQGPDRRPVAHAADASRRCWTTRASTCGAAWPTTSTTSPRTIRRWWRTGSTGTCRTRRRSAARCCATRAARSSRRATRACCTAWGAGQAVARHGDAGRRAGEARARRQPHDRRGAAGGSGAAGSRSPSTTRCTTSRPTAATSPKVFKGWLLDLAAGEARALRKTHAVRPITTRRYFAGLHRIELLVNGRPVAEATFELSMT